MASTTFDSLHANMNTRILYRHIMLTHTILGFSYSLRCRSKRIYYYLAWSQISKQTEGKLEFFSQSHMQHELSKMTFKYRW